LDDLTTTTVMTVRGETKTNEDEDANATGLVGENFTFPDATSIENLTSINDWVSEELKTEKIGQYITKARRIKRIHDQLLLKSGYPVLVSDILSFVKNNVIFQKFVDVDHWTNNYITRYKIPEIQSKWVRMIAPKSNKILSAQSQKGGDTFKYVQDTLRGIAVDNALLFDTEFYDLVSGDKDDKTTKAIEQGKNFCKQNIDYFSPDGGIIGTARELELNTIIKGLVERLGNPDEKLIWQSNFALMADAYTPQQMFIYKINNEIDQLSKSIVGADREKRKEIRTKIYKKVQAILLNHLNEKIQKEPKWLSEKPDLLVKLKQAVDNSIPVELKIQEESTSFLNNMQAEEWSEKDAARNALLVDIQKDVEFLLLPINIFHKSVAKLVEEQKKTKGIKDAENALSDINTDYLGLLFRILMSIPQAALVTAAVTVAVGTVGLGGALVLINKNCKTTLCCCGSPMWEWLKTFASCCGMPLRALYQILSHLKIKMPSKYTLDKDGNRLVRSKYIYNIDSSISLWIIDNNMFYQIRQQKRGTWIWYKNSWKAATTIYRKRIQDVTPENVVKYGCINEIGDVKIYETYETYLEE
jgi:hypothetical protein